MKSLMALVPKGNCNIWWQSKKKDSGFTHTNCYKFINKEVLKSKWYSMPNAIFKEKFDNWSTNTEKDSEPNNTENEHEATSTNETDQLSNWERLLASIEKKKVHVHREQKQLPKQRPKPKQKKNPRTQTKKKRVIRY